MVYSKPLILAQPSHSFTQHGRIFHEVNFRDTTRRLEQILYICAYVRVWFCFWDFVCQLDAAHVYVHLCLCINVLNPELRERERERERDQWGKEKQK